jgi:hypothetical protein
LYRRKQFDITTRIWDALADHLIEAMKLPLPDYRDFKAAQVSVVAKAKRLAHVQADIVKRIPESQQPIIEANARAFETAAQILKASCGKSYGAAGVLQELPLPSSIRLPDEFLRLELPQLLCSPSGPQLVSVLLKYCRPSPAFQSSLSATIDAFLRDAKLRSTPAYGALLRGLTDADITKYDVLQETVLNDLRSLLTGQASDWSFVKEIVNDSISGNREIPSEAPAGTKARIIEAMMSALSIDNEQNAALRGFEAVLPQRQTVTGEPWFISELLSKLLLLADSPDDRTADRAVHLSDRLKQLAASQGSDVVAKSTTELIAQQLAGRGQFIS